MALTQEKTLDLILVRILETYGDIKEGYKYNTTRRTSSCGSSWSTVNERQSDNEIKEMTLNDLDITLTMCKEEKTRLKDHVEMLKLLEKHTKNALKGICRLPDTYRERYPSFSSKLESVCKEYEEFILGLSNFRRSRRKHFRMKRKVKQD